MPCECQTEDKRVVGVGSGADQCRGTVTIKSWCEQIELPAQPEQPPEEGRPPEGQHGPGGDPARPAVDDWAGAVAARPAPAVVLCRVTYEIGLSASATVSVVELSVDGETFGLPNPVSPGETDFVQLAREKPADCVKKKVGTVRLECRGKQSVVDKLEVCVLS
jgi:hypothetical protein